MNPVTVHPDGYQRDVGMPNRSFSFGLTPDQEGDFRQRSLPSEIKQAKIGILLFMLPAVAFSFNDYQLFGLSDEFYGLIALRTGAVVYSIATIVYLTRVGRPSRV